MAEMKKEVFTEDEKAVLKKHVTNINDDIYCIKNLPEEVVAVLFAYVSRSPNSFKRNLLIRRVRSTISIALTLPLLEGFSGSFQ